MEPISITLTNGAILVAFSVVGLVFYNLGERAERKRQALRINSLHKENLDLKAQNRELVERVKEQSEIIQSLHEHKNNKDQF